MTTIEQDATGAVRAVAVSYAPGEAGGRLVIVTVSVGAGFGVGLGVGLGVAPGVGLDVALAAGFGVVLVGARVRVGLGVATVASGAVSVVAVTPPAGGVEPAVELDGPPHAPSTASPRIANTAAGTLVSIPALRMVSSLRTAWVTKMQIGIANLNGLGERAFRRGISFRDAVHTAH